MFTKKIYNAIMAQKGRGALLATGVVFVTGSGVDIYVKECIVVALNQ